ncbi:MAG: hypothetical protein PHT34_07820, partial [Oscillospiraceae bacterium]|nr:hypothetical protein [Oscillospiraceae bacterium]
RFWRGEAGWKAAAAARTQREGQAAESFIRPRKSRKTGTEEERLIPQTAASAYPQTMLFSGMESGGKMDLGILAGCGNPFRRIEDAMQKNAASSFLEQRERFLISQYAPLAEKKDAAGAKKILPPLSLPMADGLGDRPGRLEPSFRKAGKKAAQNLTRTAIGWEGLDAGGTALWKPAPSQLFSQATGENERKGAYTPFDLNKCLKGEKERFALRDRAEAVFPMMRMNFKKPDLRLPARWENGEFFRNSDKKSSFFRPDLLGKRISGTFPKEAFEPDFIPLPAGETKTLRERAEAPSGQSFVSLAPTVTVTTGDIRNDVDVNDLVAKIERALAVEIAASGAETLGVNE